ncbi:hypothetical protein [Marinomonas sp. PE14-40]|uniref:hypothetical protein n=1 Tax=Marinomonas sp. PE14-40 TaxID=3060621 RepID=UPI003F673030
MKLYAFKLGTEYQVFTREVEAKKDSVSNKYMIPAFATDVELIEEKEGFQRYFKNGSWHYVEDNVGVEYFDSEGKYHKLERLGEVLPEWALSEKPIAPPLTQEQLKESLINQRKSAYAIESDPLYMEWQFDQTAESEQAWRDKVTEIKARYPLTDES